MLEVVYLHNTVQTWLIAFAIAGGSIVVARVLYWIIQKTFKKFVSKTENDLDFIFVDMMEEPLTLAIGILGFWYAESLLILSDGISKFVDSIFYFVILFNVAWFITRFFDALIEKYIVPKVIESETDLDDILLPIIRKIITISIWTVTIIVGIDNAGYNVTTMITGLGLGGLVFALAAKDAVSNLFGGFIIFSDKPFKLKDRIVLEGYEGHVHEIGLRSTKLKTLEGRIVTIPNSCVTEQPVLNVTEEPGRKVKFTLGLTYDTTVEDMDKAKKILLEILDENPFSVDAIASFDSFGDFSLNILVIYWIKKSDGSVGSSIFEVTDAINMEILKRFNAQKLNFAFPTQSIILEKA